MTTRRLIATLRALRRDGLKRLGALAVMELILWGTLVCGVPFALVARALRPACAGLGNGLMQVCVYLHRTRNDALRIAALPVIVFMFWVLWLLGWGFELFRAQAASIGDGGIWLLVQLGKRWGVEN